MPSLLPENTLKIALLLAVLFIYGSTHGQRDANWWYFGKKAGLDFNPSTPTSYGNGALHTVEGSASIAHGTSGRLLFYTDGEKIWDRNHQLMNNGVGLASGTSSTDAAVIIPDPGRANRYYIFTAPTGPTVNPAYSLVDMTQNGGRGAVITGMRNVSLGNVSVSDKVAITRHSNQRDFWVVYEEYNTWNIYAYLVTAGGVSTTPVISTVAKPTNVMTVNHAGSARFSPDGKKLGMAHGNHRYFILYDFNSTTGVASNQLDFYMQPSPYGVEFSPNSQMLYVSNNDTLSQYDLRAGNTAPAIASTRHIIRSGKLRIGEIQAGPDKKIYVNNARPPRWSYLSVIDNPNGVGAACNYRDSAVMLPAGARCENGLPSFVHPYYYDAAFITEDACDGEYVKISILDTSMADSVFYNYGDTASLNNTSWNKLDSHLYSGPGKYVATAYVYYYDYYLKTDVVDTLSDTIRILQAPQVTLPPDTTICKGDTIHALVNNASVASPYELLWNDSSTAHFLKIDSIGSYSITAQNRCGVGRDTIVIDSLLRVELSLGPDTLICSFDSLVLDVRDTAAQYRWFDQDTTGIRSFRKTQKIWAEVTNFCGVISDTLDLTVLAPPTAQAGNDTTYCGTLHNSILVGEPFISKYSQYAWSNNAITYRTLAVEGWYILNETNQCGSDTDSVHITRELPLQSFFGPDSVICESDSVLLDPLTKGASCIWNSNSIWSDTTFWVTQPGVYWLHATNTCGEYRDTLAFFERKIPEISLPADTSICLGDSLTLEVKWPHTSFLWNNGSVISRIWARSTGRYWVRANNACGEDTASINVNVLQPPTAQLPNDTLFCDQDVLHLVGQGSSVDQVLWSTGNTSLHQAISLPGKYWMRISNICGMDVDTVNVEHLQKPIPNLGPDTSICEGAEIELRTHIPESILSYTDVLWNGRFTAKELYVERQNRYIAEASNRCGYGRDTLYLSLIANPNIELEPNLQVCDNLLHLDFSDLEYSFLWFDGSQSKSIALKEPGEYSVEFWDQHGCYGEQWFTVNQCPSRLWVPKAFSPNFDGINETFRAYKDGLIFYEMLILDRWNNVVFHSNDIERGWDGTVDNGGERLCAQGEYIWKIQYTEAENNQLQVITGSVALIR